MSEELRCWSCGATSPVPEPFGRSAECPHCRRDLHVCRMCRHYAPGRANNCMEPAVERVTDPARANFCDWFQRRPIDVPAAAPGAGNDAALAALFGLDAGAAPGKASAPASDALTDLFGIPPGK